MPEYRKPTYGAAINMAKLVYALAREGRSMTLEEVLDALGVSERTAHRYLKSINESLSSKAGEPLIRVKRSDGVERWMLNDETTIHATHYQLMSLYMGSMLMSFLSGTVIQDGLLDVFASIESIIPREHRKILHRQHKKFFYTSFGMKRYDQYDDQIDVLIRALLLERKVEMTYASPTRGTKQHLVHPYTLITHKDSLYLFGLKEVEEETRLYSVDRIRQIQLLDEKFEYPKDYSPEQVLKKSFGIFMGSLDNGIEVEIEFSEQLYDYVANRRWMSNQKTTAIKDGKFRMTAVVSDLFEIGHWVLSLGGEARVIRPDTLQVLIKTEIGKIQSLY